MNFRKILILQAVLFFVINVEISAQNYNWISPNHTYLKMYLVSDGMYRIGKNDFLNAGINTGGIDPRTVKIILKGNQIPIYFYGEQDGIFNDSDYIDFYGMRNYGGPTITYTENNTVKYITDEFFNQYSDTSIYWIDWGGANGLRFNSSNYSVSTLYPYNYVFDKLHFEKDKYYFQGEHNSDNDFRYLSNEKVHGEGWYWTLLSANQSISDTFSLPILNTAASVSTIRIFAYPDNRDNTITNEHTLEVSINGSVIANLISDDYKRIDTTLNFASSLLSGVSVNNVTLKYIPAPGFNGRMNIDLFEIGYPKFFKLMNGKLNYILNQTDTASNLFAVGGYNPLNKINIFDVKNNLRITNFSFSQDTIKFTSRGDSKIEIINDSIRLKPFRIKQKQVPDLVSNTNGADYLIIYNSMFQQQAEQLRSYRQTHDNFRSVKAEIEDIYDIFNFGFEDPQAIKNFTLYIYSNWQLPKLKYICLFGRGSFDPKRNSTASAYYRNFIPVYGNPNSDGYYANMNVGTFFFYDQIAIGRLPAYYPAEAQAMVDKIIAYENESPDTWSKTYSFITGGAVYSEQQYYQQTSNYECNVYVFPKPISGEVNKIYRTDTLGGITFNYADSIKNTINRGTLYINFRGHAGSHDWEIGLSDPNVLNNGNKLPIILSLTCFTGENAKSDFRGFGEKFIYLGNKGAIGFVGTSGWSFSGPGNDFGTYIIQTIKNDTNRRQGDFMKVAGKSLSNDSLNFAIRHTVNCYNLLGDPAVKLVLPKLPEFSITNNDYKLSEETISTGDVSRITIFPKNFGLYADSCKISFQLKRYNQNYLVHDTVYKAFRFNDTLNYDFVVDSNGVYTMTVVLDKDNWYPLENKNNNTATFEIPLKQNVFLPISPIDNSVVYGDSVEFSALNPAFTYNQKSVKVLLQLDTNKGFSSPVLQTFINNNISGTVTKFKTAIANNSNTLFYWRTNSIINNDSSGWSKEQHFVYKGGFNQRSNGKDRYINSQIPVQLIKNRAEQYSPTDFYNTEYNQSGAQLNDFTSNLFVRSYGSNGDEASYFTVGNRNIFIDGFGVLAGLCMIKVKKLNGSILEFKNLKMNTSTSNDSLVTFLNTFDTTHYLMLLNAAYVAGGVMLNTAAKNKLRQFGSIYCDSIGLISYFHTWSFIGFLGASHSQVSEMFDQCCSPAPGCFSCDHWTQSTSSMSVVFKHITGTLNNTFGPAQSWQDFSWGSINVPNADLKFDVIGISQTGVQTTLLTNVQTNNFTDLTSIDAYQYPKIKLVAKFNIDSVSGGQSPTLTGLNVNYVPASELIFDRNSLQVNLSSKDNGMNLSFDYRNAGYTYLYGIIVNAYHDDISDSSLIFTDTVSSLLKTDSILNYSHAFNISEGRGQSAFYVDIKPKGKYNEFYVFNNFTTFNVDTKQPSLNSAVEVFSDGKKIISGDYISIKPEIKINLTAGSIVSGYEDTTALTLTLNNKYVPFYIDGKTNPILRILYGDNQNPGAVNSLVYYPEMQTGNNKLSVVYKNENGFDTASYDVVVSEDVSVKEFYNYPNPMKTETDFIFNFGGSEIPDKIKIKIYTVSGRLVRELETSVSTGYNQIPWDGKDSDGDFVANGTYFYKLIIGNNAKAEPPVQKLVVLR